MIPEIIPFRPRIPFIYPITSGMVTPANFESAKAGVLKIVEAAVREGAALVQIREKLLTARLLFELVSEASAVTRGSRTRLLVNDRADIALAAGADGVHLTSVSIPCRAVRAVFPKGFLIGVSAHGVDEVLAGKEQGADFATFGPVFETPSKARYGPPLGIQGFREAAAAAREFPVAALGGIDEDNYRSVIGAGAAGIASIRLLNDPAKLRSLCLEFAGPDSEGE
jgi:thiamine-phosphate pyrophosphorylase